MIIIKLSPILLGLLSFAEEAEIRLGRLMPPASETLQYTAHCANGDGIEIIVGRSDRHLGLSVTLIGEAETEIPASKFEPVLSEFASISDVGTTCEKSGGTRSFSMRGVPVEYTGYDQLAEVYVSVDNNVSYTIESEKDFIEDECGVIDND